MDTVGEPGVSPRGPPRNRDARLRLSGRALARATLGREFPLSTLSMVERVPRPTIAHVSSRPPSHAVRGGFPSTASRSGTSQCGVQPSTRWFRASACSLAFLRPTLGLLAPSKRPAVATGDPPLRADLGHRSFPLSPEVLALEGVCCPFPPRLATSSARLATSASLPSPAG